MTLKMHKIENPHQSILPPFCPIGKSATILATVELAKRAAKSGANILIAGESGTGKEIFAKFIHSESKNRSGPYIALNCTAIPEHLLESELFGHAKGAFTGAQEKRVGLFEEAQGGTLFLNEIGDLNLSLQAKLLRVIQERKIKRLGENSSRNIDCRIIAATHRDLAREVAQGRFREDLFYRLHVIQISIPPLRERKEDLPLLADHFLKKYSNQSDLVGLSFSYAAIDYMQKNEWRGNVRELENTIERAVALSEHKEISLAYVMPQTGQLDAINPQENLVTCGDSFIVRYSRQLPSLNEVINRYVEFAVLKTGGARDKAAEKIGIDRKTLYRRLRISSATPNSLQTASVREAAHAQML